MSNLLSGLHSRGALPHLKKEGAIYFVTFREGGTLPKEIVSRLKAERTAIIAKASSARRPLTWPEEQDLFRWYSDRVDHYLDMANGACQLREPRCAEISANALKHFQGIRYDLRAWVIMPNHVHAVVRPLGENSLSKILHSWKSFSAHQIRKLWPQNSGSFWQTESYDHLIRDDEDLARCCRYTEQNPVNAGLCTAPEEWKWSSAHRASL